MRNSAGSTRLSCVGTIGIKRWKRYLKGLSGRSAGVAALRTKPVSLLVVAAARPVVFVGCRARHTRASRYEARLAARLLSTAAGRPVVVTPIITVVGRRVGDASEGVDLLSRGGLLSWLLFRRGGLSTEEREFLLDLARRDRAWRPR